ncbi:hypothetical protein R1flu_001169 [Riccia fluitans]|uniref:EF-hand domain-containing protein n=1 Tax=Riccia fluitans TaxID=41844 RepID=A0ABD1Y3I3_9MARC
MTSESGDQNPGDPISLERRRKVEKIFSQFDLNGDGRLNRDEMAALVIAVNPRVKFSEEQINAILDEVFRTYGDYIEGNKGLSLDGLVRTYDDGAGDVDRDFDALGLDLEDGNGVSDVLGERPADDFDKRDFEVATVASGSSASPKVVSITDENKFVRIKENVGSWASSSHDGIKFDESWKLIEALEQFLRRVDKKIEGKKKEREERRTSLSGTVEAGDWPKELGTESQREEHAGPGGRKPEDLGSEYATFRKVLADYRGKSDELRMKPGLGDPVAFDAHLAMGRTLIDHRWYAEALNSFQRAVELKPSDPRAQFRLGNALYSTGQVAEARAAYQKALDAAQTPQYSTSLRPQVHVNLGIALEGEGMLLGACEHYREAAILNPQHCRALKHLGSALLGVGEYRAAEKTLEEAIYLKSDYADAHCDLGSALHAMGENERAISEFQQAIDLNPNHVDALYNLGGLLMDSGKYVHAAEMYAKVLSLRPKHWRAQLNRAVSLLGAGESESAKKAFKEAFKSTNRVEVYGAIMYLKNMQKRPKGLNSVVQSAQEGIGRGDSNVGAAGPDGYMVIELSKFHRATRKTSPRLWLGCALDIRRFQKQTRLHKFDSSTLKHEMDTNAKKSGEVGPSANLIRKAELEKILRRLLHFLPPDAFQGSVKAINEKLLGVLDRSNTGRVDLGMFLASISPLCASLTPEKRKRLVFQILTWRNPVAEGEIAKTDAKTYIKFMRAIFLPTQGTSDMWELHGDDDQVNISFPEFVDMFDDLDWGFGILSLLAKLEVGDRLRHQGLPCAVCSYPIIGSRFKEVTSGFNLCSTCYSEGKVPVSFKQDEYNFREYGTDTESMKDKFKLFSMRNSPGSISMKEQ